MNHSCLSYVVITVSMCLCFRFITIINAVNEKLVHHWFLFYLPWFSVFLLSLFYGCVFSKGTCSLSYLWFSDLRKSIFFIFKKSFLVPGFSAMVEDFGFLIHFDCHDQTLLSCDDFTWMETFKHWSENSLLFLVFFWLYCRISHLLAIVYFSSKFSSLVSSPYIPSIFFIWVTLDQAFDKTFGPDFLVWYLWK